MKVRLISPDKEEITFNYDEDAPFTFNAMKDILQSQFNFKHVLSYYFFHNKNQITRSTEIPNINSKKEDSDINSQNKNEMIISYFSKLQFPNKSFPQTDYCFPLDFPLFIAKGAENDSSLYYPPIEGPKCIMSGQTNLTSYVEDTIEQAASLPNFLGSDPSLESLAESLANENFDINAIRNLANNFGDERLGREDSNSGSIIQRRTQFGNLIQIQQGQTVDSTSSKSKNNDKNNNCPPNLSKQGAQPSTSKIKRKHKTSSRRHLFESNAHPEEEEKDNEDAFEEYDDEEEDLAEGIDEIMEMKENYEESMTPEIEQSVERLTQLGFDRNLVTPLLFMLGDEEKTMQFLQKAFDAMQS